MRNRSLKEKTSKLQSSENVNTLIKHKYFDFLKGSVVCIK